MLHERADAADLTKANGEQEGLKTSLKNKTEEVVNRNETGYTDASSVLNTGMGKLGNGTPEAQEGTNLRKRLGGNPPSAPKPPTP